MQLPNRFADRILKLDPIFSAPRSEIPLADRPTPVTLKPLPNCVMHRTESVEPSAHRSKTLNVWPQRAKSLTETELASEARPSTLIVVWLFTKPSPATLSDEPSRTMERRLILEPSDAKLSADIADPNRE
jgi:hypothetical protein